MRPDDPFYHDPMAREYPMKREEKDLHSSTGGLFARDHLAELRTDLANRRTLLSHVRTALAFLGGGIALIKFAGHPLIIAAGWLLAPVGVFILIQGIVTYLRINTAVRAEKEKTEAAEKTVS
jgi:putative membrane protein